jgi:hypothetical protein
VKKATKKRKANGGKTAAKPATKKAASDVRQAGGRFGAGNHMGKRFGEGQPTDLGGRPPGPSLNESLRKAWERKVQGRLAVDVFAEKVITMALDGEGADALKAGQFAADRAFGVPQQSVKVDDGVARIQYLNDWRSQR